MTQEHIPTKETRHMALTSSGFGLPHESIGALIGIDDKTLRKHYRQELDLGKARANSEIAKTLFSKATGGDTACLIWWTKSQMKWSEASTLQLANAEGQNLDLRSLTDDELLRIACRNNE